MRSLVDLTELTQEDVRDLIGVGQKDLTDLPPSVSKAILLYMSQPSTRTRFSFCTAMRDLKLDYDVVGEEDLKASAGEGWDDTVTVINEFYELLILRHHYDLAAHDARRAGLTVLSAGCGTRHHPTQALIDAAVIHQSRSRLDGLRIAFVGNLDARSVRSLIDLLGLFGGHEFWFATPEELQPLFADRSAGQMVSRIADLPGDLDVLYFTRMKGVSSMPEDLTLNLAKLSRFNSDVLVMHPLPRSTEHGNRTSNPLHAKELHQVIHAPARALSFHFHRIR